MCCWAPTFQLLLTSLGCLIRLLLDEPLSELMLLFLLPDVALQVFPRQAGQHHLTISGLQTVLRVTEVTLPSAPRLLTLTLISDDGLFHRPLLFLLSPVKEV